MVSVRFQYEFTTVCGDTTTDNIGKGGITDARDATTVQYGACTVEPVVPWAPMIVYGLMVIMIFGDNV